MDVEFKPPVRLSFDSAFMSHSSKDAALAQKIVQLLEAAGCRCWIAPRDIPPGSNFDEQIMLGLEKSEAVIVLLTAAANASERVHDEVRVAKTARKRVVPIRFGAIEPSRALTLWLAALHW